MNTQHDDDREAEVERRLHVLAQALVADAPPVPPWDPTRQPTDREPRSTARIALVAASLIATVGVGSLVALQTTDRTPPAAVGSSQATPTNAGPTSTQTSVTLPSDVVSLPDETLYPVQPGDSVSAIADNYCVTPEALVQYNGWPDGVNHPLYPDDLIRIPAGACNRFDETVSAGPTSSDMSVTLPDVVSLPDEFLYPVQAGDSVSAIADHHCVSPDALVQSNGWPDGVGHALYPGELVRIPLAACNGPDETIYVDPEGDYLIEFLTPFADEFCVSVDDIIAYNGWGPNGAVEIYPGLAIRMPPNGCTVGTGSLPATQWYSTRQRD